MQVSSNSNIRLSRSSCHINQSRTVSIEELDLLYRIPNSVPISAKQWLNIDELIDVMWERLDMVRVYTRPRGRTPDYSAPVVLPKTRCTVEDFCNAIHVSNCFS